MWDGVAAKIRARVDRELADRKDLDRKRDSQHWSATEFWDDVDGLDDDLFDDDAYTEAVESGADAVPGELLTAAEIAAIVAAWRKHITKFAARVPKRIAAEVADRLNELEAELATPATPDEPAAAAPAEKLLAGLDDHLASQATSVTRYADPAWGAGQQGYGQALHIAGVKLVWVLDDGADHCDDCIELADGSPYDMDDLPSWPADGDTQCRDRCKCEIHADVDSWIAAFPEGEAA